MPISPVLNIFLYSLLSEGRPVASISRVKGAVGLHHGALLSPHPSGQNHGATLRKPQSGHFLWDY